MNLHKYCFSNSLILIFSPTRTQAKLWSQSTCSLPLLHCDGHTLGGRSTGTVTDYFGNFLQEVKARLQLACVFLAVECSGYSLLVHRFTLPQSETISLFSSFPQLIFSQRNWCKSIFTIGLYPSCGSMQWAHFACMHPYLGAVSNEVWFLCQHVHRWLNHGLRLRVTSLQSSGRKLQYIPHSSEVWQLPVKEEISSKPMLEVRVHNWN